jgi:fumarylacetoacetase
MTNRLNETHDPEARSWVTSANDANSDFPLQNLPFGVFKHRHNGEPSIGVAIGDQIVDLRKLEEAGALNEVDELTRDACDEEFLNVMMAIGPERNSALRTALFQGLRDDAPVPLRDLYADSLVPMKDVEMLVPAVIGDYTDFYASIYHATNVGSMFRPDNPLLPNYKWVPIGYHGRASSIVISGTKVKRPRGQVKADDAKVPTFGVSRRLDYELEVGVFIGEANEQGVPIDIAKAPEHIFGLALVNDWSARDMQAWEYQPLGPFLAKNFATTISPWIVTLEALAPYRIPAFTRAEGDPKPLDYLQDAEDERSGGLDITLEVAIATRKMREQGHRAETVSRGSFKDMYWTIAQLVAHHASNGCNLQSGDLLASGTVSGKDKSSRGCLLELTWKGSEPLKLANGEERRFLEDGDEVVIRGWCEKAGAPRIGFGECRGVIVER